MWALFLWLNPRPLGRGYLRQTAHKQGHVCAVCSVVSRPSHCRGQLLTHRVSERQLLCKAQKPKQGSERLNPRILPPVGAPARAKDVRLRITRSISASSETAADARAHHHGQRVAVRGPTSAPELGAAQREASESNSKARLRPMASQRVPGERGKKPGLEGTHKGQQTNPRREAIGRCTKLAPYRRTRDPKRTWEYAGVRCGC